MKWGKGAVFKSKLKGFHPFKNSPPPSFIGYSTLEVFQRGIKGVRLVSNLEE